MRVAYSSVLHLCAAATIGFGFAFSGCYYQVRQGMPVTLTESTMRVVDVTFAYDGGSVVFKLEQQGMSAAQDDVYIAIVHPQSLLRHGLDDLSETNQILVLESDSLSFENTTVLPRDTLYTIAQNIEPSLHSEDVQAHGVYEYFLSIGRDGMLPTIWGRECVLLINTSRSSECFESSGNRSQNKN